MKCLSFQEVTQLAQDLPTRKWQNQILNSHWLQFLTFCLQRENGKLHLATSCSVSEQVAQLDRPLLKDCQSLRFKGIKVIAEFLKIRKEMLFLLHPKPPLFQEKGLFFQAPLLVNFMTKWKIILCHLSLKPSLHSKSKPQSREKLKEIERHKCSRSYFTTSLFLICLHQKDFKIGTFNRPLTDS